MFVYFICMGLTLEKFILAPTDDKQKIIVYQFN